MESGLSHLSGIKILGQMSIRRCQNGKQENFKDLRDSNIIVVNSYYFSYLPNLSLYHF